VSTFDEVSLDVLLDHGGSKWAVPQNVLAASVAQMDFALAEPIRRGLLELTASSGLGYAPIEEVFAIRDLFAARMLERYGWTVEPGRVEVIGDVLQGVALVLRTLLSDGEGVVTQTPLYPNLLKLVRESKRELIENELVQDDHGQYHLDPETLRWSIGPSTRAILICNPQNPTGRAYRRDELEELAKIAEEHDLLIISDEIHADLVYPGHTHLPISSLSNEVAARTITVASASKGFNLSGLRCAVIAFGSKALHDRFRSLPRALRGGADRPGLRATAIAWRTCGAWLAELLAYLDGNRRRVHEVVTGAMPKGRHVLPEATYLAWIDCRDLRCPARPYDWFLENALVALGNGDLFGSGGRGFVRLNFATSRALLDDILERMVESIAHLD
jgi:cysteine-S-conjugate beta-lyase